MAKGAFLQRESMPSPVPSGIEQRRWPGVFFLAARDVIRQRVSPFTALLLLILHPVPFRVEIEIRHTSFAPSMNAIMRQRIKKDRKNVAIGSQIQIGRAH